MENTLAPGITGTHQVTVTTEMTASALGSGNIDVYSTPAMIALMEKTAMESIAPYLLAGHTTVGSTVNIRHVKAVKVGLKVTCSTVLTDVEGRKLVFSVEAHDKSGLIGTGTHSRHIIDKDLFMSKL